MHTPVLHGEIGGGARARAALSASSGGGAALRGSYVAIVNDYTWLPDNFVETVVDFFEGERGDLPPMDHRRLGLLSFPIVQCGPAPPQKKTAGKKTRSLCAKRFRFSRGAGGKRTG